MDSLQIPSTCDTTFKNREAEQSKETDNMIVTKILKKSMETKFELPDAPAFMSRHIKFQGNEDILKPKIRKIELKQNVENDEKSIIS